VSALPFDFELEIPSKGMLVQARLIWSRGKNHSIVLIETMEK
jgi:hypothetical protein